MNATRDLAPAAVDSDPHAHRDLVLAAIAACSALDRCGDTAMAMILRGVISRNLASLSAAQQTESEDGAPATTTARPPLASKTGAPSQSLSVEPFDFWRARDCKCESARHGDHEPISRELDGCSSCLGTGFAGYCYLCAAEHCRDELDGADDHSPLDPAEEERTEHMQRHQHLEATRLVSKRVNAYQSCVRRICDSEACLERAIADLEAQAQRLQAGRMV